MNKAPLLVSRRDAGRGWMLVGEHLRLPQSVWLVADTVVPSTDIVKDGEVQLADGGEPRGIVKHALNNGAVLYGAEVALVSRPTIVRIPKVAEEGREPFGPISGDGVEVFAPALGDAIPPPTLGEQDVADTNPLSAVINCVARPPEIFVEEGDRQ